MPQSPPSLPRLWPAVLAVLWPAAAAAAGADDHAARVLSSVNQYREARGLATLVASPRLDALAAEHSRAMAAERRLSHDGFQQRFERSGAGLCVENVAHGFRVPEQVILGWQRVETHERNLREPRVAYVGMAQSELYVTYFACDRDRP